jgi:hypothetical protein
MMEREKMTNKDRDTGDNKLHRRAGDRKKEERKKER